MEWEQVGYCDVDAGCVMLMDPCYTFPNTPFASGQPKNFGEEWYEKVICGGDYNFDASQIHGAGTMDSPGGVGVVVSSGYGDGSYPVFVKRTDGRIAEVKIVFISDDDPDDDEVCWQCGSFPYDCQCDEVCGDCGLVCYWGNCECAEDCHDPAKG